MSATISANNSKFVIFGAGHDYTLADSGEGEKIFFSHPFVPLNAVNYAGQYYFLAPVYDPSDETAEPVMTDVVKDDIAHCTFTPALNTAFSSVGETEIKVKYRREYIYDESTILVEKELTQKITVVDHGTVSLATNTVDMYTDGYAYIHPDGNNISQLPRPLFLSNSTKVSSIPWRQTYFSGMFMGTKITDITELEYADVSNATSLDSCFKACRYLESLDGLQGWNVSNVVNFSQTFAECDVLTDIEAVGKWNTTSATNMEKTFYDCFVLEDIDALGNWSVSKVATMASMFLYCYKLVDISPLSSWDVSELMTGSKLFDGTAIETLDALERWNTSKLVNADGMFAQCSKLTDVSAVAKWDKSRLGSVAEFFKQCTSLVDISSLAEWDTSYFRQMNGFFDGCIEITDYSPISNWDVSNVQTMESMFDGSYTNDKKVYGMKLRNVDFLANWDVSSCTNFGRMFYMQEWLSDLSGISDWDVSNGGVFDLMFGDGSSIRNMSALSGWDMSNASSITWMFAGLLDHSAGKDCDLIRDTNNDYFDIDGNWYSRYDSALGYISELTVDCSALENWTVSIASPTNVVPNVNRFINKPSWY